VAQRSDSPIAQEKRGSKKRKLRARGKAFSESFGVERPECFLQQRGLELFEIAKLVDLSQHQAYGQYTSVTECILSIVWSQFCAAFFSVVLHLGICAVSLCQMHGCKLAPVAPTCSLQISIQSAIAESSPQLWYEFVSKWGTANKSHVLALFLALKSPCIEAFLILKQTSTPHLAGCMPLYPILSRFQLVYVGLIPISVGCKL